LHDAATYITGLPKKEAAEPEWQAAIEALMLVVELGGPTMFARIGVVRALNRGHVRQRVQSYAKGAALGPAQAKEGPMRTVFSRRRRPAQGQITDVIRQ
jgi:hypothetical protein